MNAHRDRQTDRQTNWLIDTHVERWTKSGLGSSS